MSSDTLALLGRISDHFCFPAVPAARLKVSACRGNFSGASASHNTASAAQQHGVIPASQLLPIVSCHSSCKTATLPVDNSSGCRVLSWSSWRNPATCGPGTSCTYGWTIAPSICGEMNLVSPLKAIGLRISLRRKALASSLLRSPPGVCLWSPHQTTRPLRGTLAMAEDSSKFPYCWPSSLRATSTSDIHRATGLYGCVHSWWKPPPQPMITCFAHKTSLRKPGRTSFRFAGRPFFSLSDTHQSAKCFFQGGWELERLNVLGKGMRRCVLLGHHHDLLRGIHHQ